MFIFTAVGLDIGGIGNSSEPPGHPKLRRRGAVVFGALKFLPIREARQCFRRNENELDGKGETSVLS